MREEEHNTMNKPYVVVRTYSAGVHCGVLASHQGKEVVLTDARRIWAWQGANTLHEISLRGAGVGSKISEAVAEIVLTEAIEVIPCTAVAEANLRASTWA
jgi:hypothetical protein